MSAPQGPLVRAALQGFTPERLVAYLPGLLAQDARRIVSALYRGRLDLNAQLPGVRRKSLEQCRERLSTPTLQCSAEQASGFDGFVKYAFRTHDGHALESVRIPLERTGRYSVCVSSQVGCALGCAFCATGRLGLKRNLSTWEIVEQVRHVRDALASSHPAARVHGVVFQGMGEPLANLDRVLEAIDVLRSPCALQVCARNITVSTAGLPEGIRRLSREAPKVRLAWSIGSAFQGVRASLMPIGKAHPLDEVLDAVAEHARRTGMAPLWAVTLLAGVNDGFESGEALGEMARGFAERVGVRPRLSVIPYNRIDGDADPFRRSSDDAQRAFVRGIESRGLRPHFRYSGGAEVQGACGQLAGRVSDPGLATAAARPA